MQGNYNKNKQERDKGRELPKINSQKRIHTTMQRRNTQQDKALTNRPLSNNGRTKSLRTLTTKTMKYQATGANLNKKIQQIQKKHFLIDKQMKQVQQQIDLSRKKVGESRRQGGISRLNQSTTSYLSKISSRKISSIGQQGLKSQLKNLQTKFLTNRNKIDIHLQKNKAIQKQIDTYRKQIQTLKKINQTLDYSYQQTFKKYEEQYQLSKKLDHQIAHKNELTYKKKVQNMHQKTQMIKQYDVILRTLQKQLANSKENSNEEHDKSNFYLTDLAHNIGNNNNNETNPNSNLHSNQKFILNSSNHKASSKRLKITDLHQKLNKYQQEFKQLKQKVGSGNIQQITKKFTEQYQKNFHQYNFINQMFEEYQQTNLQQLKLIERKKEILKEIQAQKSNSKVKEILQYRQKIKNIQKKKQTTENDMRTFDKVSHQIIECLRQYFDQESQQGQQLKIDINSISKYLHLIFDNQFNPNKKTLNMQKRPTNNSILEMNNQTQSRLKPYQDLPSMRNNNSILTGRQNIDDLLQQVKKDTQYNKDNRLLSREQLQNNTIQLRERKMENSLNKRNQKFINKKDIQKIRYNQTKSQISNNIH